MASITLRKQPETYVPCVIGLLAGVPTFIKNVCVANLSEYFEARKGGKPLLFKERTEEMILDELHVFDDCPGKDVLSSEFSIEKQPLSAKYRFFVADDLLGVVLGQTRNLAARACYVGLPYNMDYDSIDDVAKDCDRLKIVAHSRSWSSWWKRVFRLTTKEPGEIEWGSPLGVQLMETLLLSDDAKRFLIQRSIQEADTANHMLMDFSVFVGPLSVAAGMNFIVRRYIGGTSHQPMMSRSPVLWPYYFCSSIAACAGIIWMRKWQKYYTDTKSDSLTVSIGEQYKKGALEYYNKLLNRNRCINELLQKANQEKMYEKDGDYVQRYVFRRPETSLKQRMKLIMDTRKEEAQTKSATNYFF